MGALQNIYKKLYWINKDIENAKKGNYTVLCLKAWKDDEAFGYVALYDPSDCPTEKIRSQAVVRFKGKCKLETVTKIESVSYEFASVLIGKTDLWTWGPKNFVFELKTCNDLLLSNSYREAVFSIACQLGIGTNKTLIDYVKKNSAITNRLSSLCADLFESRKKIEYQILCVDSKIERLIEDKRIEDFKEELEKEESGFFFEEEDEFDGIKIDAEMAKKLSGLEARKNELQEFVEELLEKEDHVRAAICRKNYESALGIARHSIYQKYGFCPTVNCDNVADIEVFEVGFAVDKYLSNH